METDTLVVDAELEPRDLRVLQYYLQRRIIEHRTRRNRVIPFIAALSLTMIALLVLQALEGRVDSTTLLSGGLIGVGVMLILLRASTKHARDLRAAATLGRFRIQFDATGVRSWREGAFGSHAWNRVTRIDANADHLFLLLDPTTAYIIPKRAIRSPSAEELVARLQQWHAAALGGATAPPFTEPELSRRAALEAAAPLPAFARASASSFWHALAQNLRTGMRIFFLARANASDLSIGFGQIVALTTLAVLVTLIIDVSQIKETSAFYEWAFYTWFAAALLVIWVSALVTRAVSAKADSRVMIVAALAVAPWAIAMFWIISLIGDSRLQILVPVLTGLTVFLLGMRIIRVVHGFATFTAFAIMLLTTLIVAVGVEEQYLYGRLWPDYGEGESSIASNDPDWQAAESTLFDQPERIAEAIDDLAPERPGVADVFFVGFAGDGSERVFRREALFAKDVIARRMGSGERSIELINDIDDRISYPLGSAVGLRYALVQLASRMNVAEDILVLMLTSHGDSEDGIYVSNGSLPLNNVEPEVALRALDASGIKWRVVIVSACYSGTFIEPLQNENTMIITASDAENTSFGCADDRDLTYFGEAFLRDALPNAPSLASAFETAREAIAERERIEKLTSSNPQIFVGEAIRQKLAALGDFPLN